jgi:hypothetical protein
MKLGDPRTGSLGQIRRIHHASDLRRRESQGQQQNLQKKELQVARKNSMCASLADEQRRHVDWQRQGHHPQTKRQAQTAETASVTKKITSQYWVKFFEKRGRSVWPKGLHLARIFKMRSHLIPRSM